MLAELADIVLLWIMGQMLKTSQVALLLHVSERTVRRWADNKIIKAKVLPSGHRRFDEKEINKIKQGA
jgi:excisionase family DNA binding protein